MLMRDEKGSKQGHTNNMYIHVYPGIDSPGAGAQYITRVLILQEQVPSTLPRY